MKAKVIKEKDVDRYNFRNECVNKVYEVVKTETISPFGKLHTLDTTNTLGCVTAWTEDFLELQ